MAAFCGVCVPHSVPLRSPWWAGAGHRREVVVEEESYNTAGRPANWYERGKLKPHHKEGIYRVHRQQLWGPTARELPSLAPPARDIALAAQPGARTSGGGDARRHPQLPVARRVRAGLRLRPRGRLGWWRSHGANLCKWIFRFGLCGGRKHHDPFPCITAT